MPIHRSIQAPPMAPNSKTMRISKIPSGGAHQIIEKAENVRGGEITDPRNENRTKNETTPRKITLSTLKQKLKTNGELLISTTWADRKRLFLDKIALISDALLKSDNATVEEELGEDEEITHQSDLTLPHRRIWVVTTAALPWMTGTAVNPLLRAAYLARYSRRLAEDAAGTEQLVTLVVPWLELEEDRIELYGHDHNFRTPEEQEHFIRDWMRRKADLTEEADPLTGLRILFYPARYHSGMRSIFAMGDICSLIPHVEADVCVLEEPEHLNWYRAPGDGWTKKFNYVVGIVHTNYKEYASGQYHGLWTSPAIGIISSAMVRAYCHKVIKLSDVLQTYAPEKEVVSNVHGVRSEFLEEGRRRALSNTTLDEDQLTHANKTQAYFIGKIIWPKGLDRLLELEDFYRQCTGDYFAINIYGSGPEQKEIMRAFHGRRNKHHAYSDANSTQIPASSISQIPTSSDYTPNEEEDYSTDEYDSSSNDEQKTNLTAATRAKLAELSQKFKNKTDELPKSRHELRRKPIPSLFPGRIDHSLLKEYKIFVNPSVTEVLCTTTAEALAMGKFAIVPIHPSNDFFLKFPNCLAYRNKMEFAASLRWALLHSPEPLTEEQAREFTWEAATERFIRAAAITKREAHFLAKLGRSKLDDRIAWFHNQLGKGAKGDTLRKVLGGGPVSEQYKYMARMEEGSESEEEYEEEGMSGKFRGSSLVSAIRYAFSSALLPLNARFV